MCYLNALIRWRKLLTALTEGLNIFLRAQRSLQNVTKIKVLLIVLYMRGV